MYFYVFCMCFVLDFFDFWYLKNKIFIFLKIFKIFFGEKIKIIDKIFFENTIEIHQKHENQKIFEIFKLNLCLISWILINFEKNWWNLLKTHFFLILYNGVFWFWWFLWFLCVYTIVNFEKLKKSEYTMHKNMWFFVKFELNWFKKVEKLIFLKLSIVYWFLYIWCYLIYLIKMDILLWIIYIWCYLIY